MRNINLVCNAKSVVLESPFYSFISMPEDLYTISNELIYTLAGEKVVYGAYDIETVGQKIFVFAKRKNYILVRGER